MDLDLHCCARLLQSINTHHFINQGRQLHLLFLKRGVLHSALTVVNRLLQMYTRCGHLTDARRLFDEMPQRNCFSWNTMIEGYMKSGNKGESLGLFSSMPDKNEFSWNVVVLGFIKVGELEMGRRLFQEMPRKNVMAWNSIIHGYVCSGYPREAVRMFRDLSESFSIDSFVMATVIGACTDLLALDWGKQIHARIIVNQVEFDSVLGSALVNMYGKSGDLDGASHVLNSMTNPDDFSLSALISGYANCGRMNDARRIFHMKGNPCVVLWNSMISGYVAGSKAMEALAFYAKMRENGVKEDFSTFASVLSACSTLGVLEHGKQMHAHACKFGVLDDLIVVTGFIDMYTKCRNPEDACRLFGELRMYDTVILNSMITTYSNCGRLEDAKQVFESMQSKSLISWNSMIVGLSQNGCAIEALDLFCKMNKIGLKMDKFSLASVISACASILSLDLGEQVFARSTVLGLEFDQIISTSLIDLYCKCGFVQNGRKLFDQMIEYDEASWNSMLMGYAMNGYGFEALALFDEMRCGGFMPSGITFTAVLSACDHCGLVEDGRKWFYAMKLDYHTEPGIEHYSCMVDLLARAGFLEEAMKLVDQMPFEVDESMWSSVLRGCVAHGDKILGKNIVERIQKLDPENSGAYVQLSSMLANSGDWERSAQVRKLMREKRIRKTAGCSWADG